MGGIALLGSASGVHSWLESADLCKKFPRIVTTAEAAALECQRRGIDCEPIESFHALEDVGRINRAAYDLSRWWEWEWVQRHFPEFREIDGLNIGPALELPFYHVFSEAVRSVFISRRLFERIRPTSMLVSAPGQPEGGFWTGFSLNLKAEAASLVAENAGVPVTALPGSDTRPRPVSMARALARRARSLVRDIRCRLGNDLTIAQRAHVDLKPGDFRDRVLVYGEGRHAETMWPLLKEMLKDRDLLVIGLAQDMPEGIRHDLVRSGGVLFDADGRFGDAAGKRAEHSAATIRARWDATSSDEKWQTFGAHIAGVSLWPLVKFQFAWLFQSGVSEIFRRALVAANTLDLLRPKLLLTPVDSSVKDLCWLLPAKTKGVPTLTQLHGAVYTQPSGAIWGRSHADKLAVFGQLTREWHVKELGRPADDFVCVGYPLFDELIQHYNDVDGDALRQRIGLEQDKPVVLFLVSMTGGAVGSYYGSARRIYESFLSALQAVGHAQAVIRTHPASDANLPNFLAGKAGARCIVNPDTDLVSILKVADVVVGQPTTALIEAMLVKKPVVLYAAEMADEMLWWTQHGKLQVAGNEHELAATIKRLLEDRNERAKIIQVQDAFSIKVTGPVDGCAAARTLELAKKMISQNRHEGNAAAIV